MHAHQCLVADGDQFDEAFVQPALERGMRGQTRDLRVHHVVLRNQFVEFLFEHLTLRAATWS